VGGDRVWRAAALASSSMLLFWLATSADPRYLVPTAGIFAIGTGLVVDAVRPSVDRVVRRWGIVAFAPVVLALVLVSTITYGRAFIDGNGLPPDRPEAQAKFVYSRMPCASGIAYLNDRFGSAYSAYSLQGCVRSVYWAQGPLMGDWFGAASYFRVLGADAKLTDPRRTAGALRARGIKYLVAPTGQVSNWSAVTAPGLFHLVYSGSDSDVLAVGD
jgi:hypothetical protein